MEITLTKDNFAKEVLEVKIPVLVDFWAPWCGPCKMQNPILAEFTQEMEGKVKVSKVNVDEEPSLAAKYAVMSIPTLLWFNKGKVIAQRVGVQSRDKLIEEFKKISKVSDF